MNSVLLLYLYIMLPKRTRRLIGDSSTILGKKNVEFLEEGIRESSENSMTLFKWASIKSVYSENDSIYIMVDNVAAIIIPKRYFIDESDEKKIMALLDKNKVNV